MNKFSTTQDEKIQIDFTRYESPTYAISVGVATLTNTPVCDLKPIFNSTNEEAINDIFDHTYPNEKLVVDVEIDGWAVTIRNNGELTISG
jgi:hypothetical protein